MKIKNYIILIAVCCGFVFNSCHDLDLEPKGFIPTADVFSSEAAIQMFFAKMYCYLPIEDFNYRQNQGYNNDSRDANFGWQTWNAVKECQQQMSGEFWGTWRNVDNNGHTFWPYGEIRSLNGFILDLPNYKNEFTEAKYKALLGEAHFLRAFYYSGMARRYGGVPIVTEVQDPYGDPELLKVKRNTEYDTWKFIYSDLKFAVDNMQSNDLNIYRANKYTALALMSRTMLYAGRIAKYSQSESYGSQTAFTQRLCTIDPQYAKEFFEYAYWAGTELEKGPYRLYTKVYPDKAANFAELFLDLTSPETIFVKDYGVHESTPHATLLLGHTWDTQVLPFPDVASFNGAVVNPSLDMMLRYEFPSMIDADSVPIFWDSPKDIRNEMEPRLRGSMYFSGDVHAGTGVEFDIRRGIYRTWNPAWTIAVITRNSSNNGNGDVPNLNNNRVTSNQALPMTNIDAASGKQITGRHGIRHASGGDNISMTGAFIRKYVDYRKTKPEIVEHRSHQPWIVFRLAEIYLNTAEAAYELGLGYDVAFKYIEKIRDRAGCKMILPTNDPSPFPRSIGLQIAEPTGTVLLAYDDAYPEIDNNLQFIRQERNRELWGENHWWWDLLTWRTAYYELNGQHQRALACYWVQDRNKYIYINERCSSDRDWNANRNCYYQAIPGDQISANPNLVQNVNR